MRHRKIVLATAVTGVLAVVGAANLGGASAEMARVRWGESGVSSASEPAAEAATAAEDVEPSDAEVAALMAQSFVLIEEETNMGVFIDLGEEGESIGDSFMFRDRLRDPESNEHVGAVSVQCTVSFQFSSECAGTVLLFGRGKLTIAGNVPFSDRFAIAITGGTGEFRGASGQAIVNDTPGPTDRVVVQLV